MKQSDKDTVRTGILEPSAIVVNGLSNILPDDGISSKVNLENLESA